MTHYTSPTREQIRAIMSGFNLSNTDVAEIVMVAERTVKQWLASDTAKRRSLMPPGLFKLLIDECAKRHEKAKITLA